MQESFPNRRGSEQGAARYRPLTKARAFAVAVAAGLIALAVPPGLAQAQPEPFAQPAGLSLDRAAFSRGQLVVRGSLRPAACCAWVHLRLRAGFAGSERGEMRFDAPVQQDGRFARNVSLPAFMAATVKTGVLDVLFRGTFELRRQHVRVRAAQVAPRLRVAHPQTRGNAFRVRGRMDPRLAGSRLAVELHFNRADGSPQSRQTRVRTDRRGRFQLRGRSPAVRDPRARVSVIYPGRGKVHGQVADRALMGLMG